jgi:Domain of unknown function (DUF3825)/OST-HTH/LOTUS domain
MRSLFQLISRFFQRLFKGNDSPSENRLERSHQRFSSPSSGSPSGRADRLLADESESASLRRLIYQATYQLPQKKRTHAAQVGALLRQEDRTFSYEKYKFAKLIDLLESVPDLVAMEKVSPHPGNPNSAPVYYVRPVVDIRQLLTRALMSHDSAEGWMHLESVREAVSDQDPSFSTQRYGFNDFTAFVQSRADLIEFKVDSPGYVRLIQSQAPGRAIAKPAKLLLKKSAPNVKPRTVDPNGHSQVDTNDTNGHRHSASARSGTVTIEPLSKFANLPMETLHQKVSELAAIALPENWYFGSQPPAEFAYPILKSYLRYTFIRLQHEGKVIASSDQQHRAFNTGLLDTLLRPIYGLLSGPSSGLSERQWNLAFCIAGEGFAGKKLVAQFADLPVAANYFANADQAFYHLAAGTPQVDWQHVVKDNMARLPLAFFARYAPAGFTPRSTQGLTTPEFFDYKRAFVAALDADPAGYRTIVRKLEEALERTLKRIQINYKTAVPTYYPKLNSIDLLLPMCLVDENTVDLALVVRREPSGQYIGHTVLTLRQAYNNARLICKLDEHWLTRSLALSQEDFGEDEEEEEIEDFAADNLATDNLATDNLASLENNKVATNG